LLNKWEGYEISHLNVLNNISSLSQDINKYVMYEMANMYVYQRERDINCSNNVNINDDSKDVLGDCHDNVVNDNLDNDIKESFNKGETTTYDDSKDVLGDCHDNVVDDDLSNDIKQFFNKGKTTTYDDSQDGLRKYYYDTQAEIIERLKNPTYLSTCMASSNIKPKAIHKKSHTVSRTISLDEQYDAAREKNARSLSSIRKIDNIPLAVTVIRHLLNMRGMSTKDYRSVIKGLIPDKERRSIIRLINTLTNSDIKFSDALSNYDISLESCLLIIDELKKIRIVRKDLRTSM